MSIQFHFDVKSVMYVFLNNVIQRFVYMILAKIVFINNTSLAQSLRPIARSVSSLLCDDTQSICNETSACMATKMARLRPLLASDHSKRSSVSQFI